MRKAFAALVLFVACGREDSEQVPHIEPAPAACVSEWTNVANGIEYRQHNCKDSAFDLHLIRIDPRRATIDAVVKPGSTAGDLGGEWTFAINANFFDEQFRPLGLVMSEGKELTPLHPVSWQSVFAIDRSGKARIVPMKEWKRGTTKTAVQCGPRLVINGEPNQVVRAVEDWRSGVCIEKAGKVVFFATPHDAQFDVHQIRALAHEELRCRDAMLFDGGPSVQMFLRRGDDPVMVEGDKRVPAYVVAK